MSTLVNAAVKSLSIKCRGFDGEIYKGASIWADRYFDGGARMECGKFTVIGFTPDAHGNTGFDVVHVFSPTSDITEVHSRDVQSVYTRGGK